VEVPALIRVIRKLGVADRLENLVPDVLPSPMESLARAGRARHRASRRRVTEPQSQGSTGWAWRDQGGGTT
jgi:hypothetical protein